MYEHMTFESIMQRMLSNASDTEKREGSIVYTAEAPMAVELVNAYIQIDFVRKILEVYSIRNITWDNDINNIPRAIFGMK